MNKMLIKFHRFYYLLTVVISFLRLSVSCHMFSLSLKEALRSLIFVIIFAKNVETKNVLSCGFV